MVTFGQIEAHVKFSIATKISILTSLLVLATVFIAAYQVASISIGAVVDHEVVDLADETKLTAEQARREISVSRRDLSILAGKIRNKPDDQKSDEVGPILEAVKNGENPSSNLQRWLGVCNKEFELQIDRNPFPVILARDRLELLRVELFAVKRDGTILSPKPLVTVLNPSVLTISDVAGQDKLVAGVSRQLIRSARISEFNYADVTYSKAKELPRQDREKKPLALLDRSDENGRKLLLQVGAVSQRWDKGEKGPDVRLIVVGTFHCQRLDRDVSEPDQTAVSPRHFQFLIRPDGELIDSPLPNGIRSELRATSMTDAFPQIAEFLDSFRTRLREEEEQSRARGGVGNLSGTLLTRGKTSRAKEPILESSLASLFCLSKELKKDSLLVASLDISPSTPDDDQTKVRKQEIRRVLNEWLRANPDFTISLPDAGTPRFKVRSRSDDRSRLIALKKGLADVLAQQGFKEESDEIVWQDPVPLKKFAVHALRMEYEPDLDEELKEEERAIDLAVAVSLEEIGADVNGEVRSAILPRAILIGVLTAFIATLFSLLITRPLNKIIESTARIGRGEFDVELPVQDRGEVGVLARSFRDMAEQIRARKQELVGLNAQLSDEKDSLEERVFARTVELQSTMERLKAATEEAIEANKAKNAFVAQMSHELRTPLNAIIGYSELLIEEAQEEESTQHYIPDLRKIIDAGKHLLVLINDILDISKIEAGKMELYNEGFEIRPMIESVMGQVENVARKNANHLRWSCDEKLTTMVSDKTRVRQVLLNLLSNACKFTKDGEVSLTATLETRDGVPMAVFAVRDTGIGMTPEQLAKLFQSFHQADASINRKFGGIGLGLVISRRFCEMMGGDVTVVSEFGKGSTFTAHIPIRAADKERVLPPPRSKETTVNGEAGTVLIIDDEAPARELLQRCLEKEGFRVLTADGGREGLRLAREHQPAFITLDIIMPSMDGWEVLSTLKSDSQLHDIPVIVTTMVEDRDLGIALGADEFLTKPIDRERLVEIASRHRNMAIGNHEILVVDDDVPTRSLICRYLHGAGWHVIEAEDGRAGIEALKKCRPSVIFLDLMMPVMNGFAFLSQLRTMEEFKSTPVVVITSKDLSQDERNWLKGEVQQILTKGNYNREQVLEQVRRLVPQATASQSASTAGTA